MTNNASSKLETICLEWPTLADVKSILFHLQTFLSQLCSRLEFLSVFEQAFLEMLMIAVDICLVCEDNFVMFTVIDLFDTEKKFNNLCLLNL